MWSYSKLQRKTSLNQISKNLTSHDKLRCLKWIILNCNPLNCFRQQELGMKYQVLNSIKWRYVWMKTVMLSAMEFCLWTEHTKSCLQGHLKVEGLVGSTSKSLLNRFFSSIRKRFIRIEGCDLHLTGMFLPLPTGTKIFLLELNFLLVKVFIYLQHRGALHR